MGIKFEPPSAEELARRGVGEGFKLTRPAKSPVSPLTPRKPRRKTPAKPKE